MKKYLIIAAAIVFALASCKNTKTQAPVKKVDAQKFFKENIEKAEALCMRESVAEGRFFPSSISDTFSSSISSEE